MTGCVPKIKIHLYIPHQLALSFVKQKIGCVSEIKINTFILYFSQLALSL
jgi:hypothetical protein